MICFIGNYCHYTIVVMDITNNSYKIITVELRNGSTFTASYNIEDDDIVSNNVFINGNYIPKYDKFGRTRFMLGCLEGNLELVKSSIRKYSARINDPDINDWTPLMITTQKGYTELVKMLVFEKAELDHIDIDGNSALMIACYLGYIEIVKILLKAGANIYLVDKYGDTALMMASKKRYYNIVRCIEQCYN
jgi:ankyrin repeat protein